MKKLIELHEEWCEKGRLHDDGLCEVIPREYVNEFYLLHPNRGDLVTLRQEKKSEMYWASGLAVDDVKKLYKYTPPPPNNRIINLCHAR